MEPLTDRLARLGRAAAEVDRPDRDAIADARHGWDEVTNLARLGRSVGDTDHHSDRAAIADARERWAEAGTTPRKRTKVWLLVPAAAIAAAAGVLLGLPSNHAADLTFEVDHLRGGEGDWVAAEQPSQLRFSDGSRVELTEATRVRVASIDARGSTIDLERGTIQASIVHAGATSWNFRGGPYTIHVTGTRFATAWDPALSRFTLDMFEGSVELRGPLISTSVVIAAGHSVVAIVGEQRFEIMRRRDGEPTKVASSPAPSLPPAAVMPPTVAANDAPPTAPAVPSPPHATATHATERSSAHDTSATPSIDGRPTTTVPPPTVARVESSATPPSTPPGHAVSAPSWREHLASGASSQALVAAERSGFDSVVGLATRDELYALADAARYANRLERAKEALLALRSRFSEQGKTAFLLGRVFADRAGAEQHAITWFETYLREEPTGSLADAATGRLIELYRTRDRSRARALAERYLATYPDGAHAALARSLLAP